MSGPDVLLFWLWSLLFVSIVTTALALALIAYVTIRSVWYSFYDAPHATFRPQERKRK